MATITIIMIAYFMYTYVAKYLLECSITDLLK